MERTLHWVNATLFAVLMFTGAVLYYGPLEALVGRRVLVRDVHVWCGLALPVVFTIAVAPRWGRQLRHDVRALNRFVPDDFRWLRSRAARLGGHLRLGKFNPGQKLNAAFVAGAAVVMVATGSVMNWFSLFPVDWRTGAEFVHDWFAIAIWIVVIGHVWIALTHPEALRGMLRGSVDRRWAERTCPEWTEGGRGEGDAPLEATVEAAIGGAVEGGVGGDRR